MQRVSPCFAVLKNITESRDAASAFQLAFAEKLPFIPLYFRLNSIVYSTDIKGMTDVREPDIMRSVDKWYMFTGSELHATGH